MHNKNKATRYAIRNDNKNIKHNKIRADKIYNEFYIQTNKPIIKSSLNPLAQPWKFKPYSERKNI